MSNIYHTEPPTQGKVLLKTTYGDIDIELWPKEAPLACRNFIQLALEGYYDKTKVNRVIKEFMVQFGDPTGTGSGGESIWGRPFKDEIHGRLLFNHRGQLAMANESTPNSNKSQFFVTLGACEWLNRKHTIFGKVTGDTIYNLLRLGESDIDANDRPVEPIELLGVEILWNPFEDIVPRNIQKEVVTAAPDNTKKRKAVKDLKLLSFSNEEGEEEEEEGSSGNILPTKMISAPQTKNNSKKLNSKNKNIDEIKNKNDKKIENENKNENEKDFEEAKYEKMLRDAKKKAAQYNFDDEDDDDDDDKNDAKSIGNGGEGEGEEKGEKRGGEEGGVGDGFRSHYEDSEEAKKKKMLKEKGSEFQKLRENLLRSKRAVKVLTGTDAAQVREDIAANDLISPLEQRRLKYMKKKVEFGARQDETFAKLQNFTSSLRKNKSVENGNEDNDDNDDDGDNQKTERVWKNAKVTAIDNLQSNEIKNSNLDKKKITKIEEFEAYNGQVLEEGSGDEDLGNDWHAGKLKFRKHITDKLRIGGDGRKVDDYVVLDSRLNKKEIDDDN